MSGACKQISFVRAARCKYPRTAFAAILIVLGVELTRVCASEQDPGSFYQPLGLGSADSPSPGGPVTNPSPKAKGQIDYTDPRVAAAVSEAMDNPISELLILWNQFDAIQVHFPGTSVYHERDEWAYKYQFMPTIPVPLGEHWNWVSRVNMSVVSLPLKAEVGDMFQLDPAGNLNPNAQPSGRFDPFGRTTGLGDLAYVGLVGPKQLPKVAGGKLILAAGPTFLFPTASETILGQGKWEAGPSVAVGLITEHWRLGVFPQQWWSFAGNARRQSVSQLNLQYFLYYAPTPEWEIGIAPNMFVNWNAPSGNQLTFPVGLGVHRTFNIGQLPVSIGLEVDYSVIHPDTWPGSRWDIRLYLMPVAPAPWGNLARELRALQ
jgi:hypothetical protein